MRVTIGERLGLPTFRINIRSTRPPPDEAVPTWIEPEKAGPVLRLDQCPSSTRPFGSPFVRPSVGGPPRVRGEMVWLGKTAPAIVIEGRPDLSPEEHASGRRR
jgi:hypothetical protein